MQSIANKIIDSISIKPTTIVNINNGCGFGIAWNAQHYYCDVEITENNVEFAISKDRKSLKFIVTDFDGIDYGINELKDYLNFLSL